jgi:tRNA-2-methylthio-N6-dimethylallyladenosine synthase
LKDMRRSYRAEKYLGIIDRVRKAIPDAAISTDLIVGFPGETEEEFQDTMKMVEQVGFAICYSYLYSTRPGTPAADLPNQVSKDTAQNRFERLMAHANEIAWKENKLQIGKVVEVLVANDGRKDDATGRLTGRARDNRLVHFSVPQGVRRPRAGDLVTVTVHDAAPYHLLSDPKSASEIAIRRTIGGDASERLTTEGSPERKSLSVTVRK